MKFRLYEAMYYWLNLFFLNYLISPLHYHSILKTHLLVTKWCEDDELNLFLHCHFTCVNYLFLRCFSSFYPYWKSEHLHDTIFILWADIKYKMRYINQCWKQYRLHICTSYAVEVQLNKALISDKPLNSTSLSSTVEEKCYFYVCCIH